MALRRLRRDGNSLVVTIPADEAQKAHLAEGDMVDVHTNEQRGTIEIEPVQIRRRANFEELGFQVIQEDIDLLDRLAEYDHGKRTSDTSGS